MTRAGSWAERPAGNPTRPPAFSGYITSQSNPQSQILRRQDSPSPSQHPTAFLSGRQGRFGFPMQFLEPLRSFCGPNCTTHPGTPPASRGRSRIAAQLKPEKSDAFRDLKYPLQEGRRLAGRLDRGETCEVARDKDYVYDWARATWRDLDHHRPTLAREFFGNKCPYGHYQSDFSAACGIEVDRIGRRAYLADRIATLTRAVEAS
jgi:hypothetical protein